jgi:hypothetical protein
MTRQLIGGLLLFVTAIVWTSVHAGGQARTAPGRTAATAADYNFGRGR